MNYIELAETPSTNTYAAERASTLPHGTVVSTLKQTAGRGQRGNVWEAEPGMNITMSVVLHPSDVHPSRQFSLSEAVAVATVRTLSEYAEDFSIKWPNDIYHADKKICGLLIEHSLSGARIDSTIAGIGVNVNQQVFRSDAPNPQSLRNIVCREIDRDALMRRLAEEIVSLCDALPEDEIRLHQEYLSLLYRREGFHEYVAKIRTDSADGRTALASGERFWARIANVRPDGMLELVTDTGAVYVFAFKEVAYRIPGTDREL